MRFRTSMLSAVAALALIAAPTLTSLAQQKPASATKAAKAAAVDHTAQGSVVTVTAQSLVIRSKGKDMTLALKPDTQKLGDIAAGKQVTVHYRDENKQHMATSIQEDTGKKPAAATKKS